MAGQALAACRARRGSAYTAAAWVQRSYGQSQQRPLWSSGCVPVRHAGRRRASRLPHLRRAIHDEVEQRDADLPPVTVPLTNARDLSEACASIRPGLLLRTANPFLATPCAVPGQGRLQLLDLRHPEEYERDDMSNWEDLVVKERVFNRAEDGKTLEADEWHTPPSNGARQVVLNRISVLDRERIQKGLLFRKMSFWTSFKVLFWMVFDIARMQALVVREINAGGLKLLYELILDTSGEELAGALDVVLESVEAGQPVVFFCKLGKDRTGLVAALILSIMGARDVSIVLDYAKSDGNSRAGLGDLEDKRVDGIDRRQFSRAPAAAMLASLNYITTRHGSVSAYLAKSGFGHDKQERLRAALQVEEPGV